jgi:hypothetical protein
MRKSLLLFLACLPGHFLFSQNWTPEFNLGYVYSAPTLGMKKTIRQAHGLNISMAATTPGQRLTYGLELNYGAYGGESSRQVYTFSDGTNAEMDINVSNSFTNLVATTRLNLTTGGTLQPYLLVKGGYSWYQTNLSIYDPDDRDHCEPVETEMLQKDGAFLYSLGGGLQINLSSVFKRLRANSLYLDFQSSIIQGGRVQYMNSDAPQVTSHHGSTRTTDIQAEFINTQTLVTHKHHVGYLYSSFINMMDFRLGLTVRPARVFRNW